MPDWKFRGYNRAVVALANDGRGWVRSSDLSRVRRGAKERSAPRIPLWKHFQGIRGLALRQRSLWIPADSLRDRAPVPMRLSRRR